MRCIVCLFFVLFVCLFVFSFKSELNIPLDNDFGRVQDYNKPRWSCDLIEIGWFFVFVNK